MVRRILFVVLSTSMILGAPNAVAAAPPAVDRASAQMNVPMGVDRFSLMAPTQGPVVATGHLVDSLGRATAGTVAAVAWPNEAYNRTIQVGDIVTTSTVGWAAAARDGSFTLRIDAAKVGASYLRTDGTVNLSAVGWTASSQGTWAFTAQVNTPTRPLTAASPQAISTARFVISAKQHLVTAASPTMRQPLSGAAYPACGWSLRSYYDVMVRIGSTEPFGADVAWMNSQASESMTVGVGSSISGAYGSWSRNGTSTTSAATSFDWPATTFYRLYQRQVRYGRYQQYCGAIIMSVWEIRPMYGTGGYGNLNYGYSSYANCAPIPPGTWTRSASSGNHWSDSGGVLIAGNIGINFSIDTNWDSSHTMTYQTASYERICGDNRVPSLASNVNTAP